MEWQIVGYIVLGWAFGTIMYLLLHWKHF